MEEYFYPTSNYQSKTSKTEDLRLLLEIFFVQTFIVLSIIYTMILVIISNYNISANVGGRSLNSIEFFLAISLPIITLLLYQKFGFITLPSIANGVYLLLFQDYNLPHKVEFILVSINTRILLIMGYIIIGFYMAYYRFDKLADDGIIVYYISYLAVIIKVLLEYFENDGSGLLAFFLIIFVTIFILFMFQTISAFVVGFLLGLYLLRKRMSVHNTNFFYPSYDGREDTQNQISFDYL